MTPDWYRFAGRRDRFHAINPLTWVRSGLSLCGRDMTRSGFEVIGCDTDTITRVQGARRVCKRCVRKMGGL